MGKEDNSGRRQILLVEDHLESARALSRLLQAEGHTVTLASRLDDAARLCRENSFDVLLVDGDLPDGNGLELLGRVRDTCRAAAIVFSGYCSDELRNEAKSRGYADYLLKPVQFDVLSAAIRRATNAGDHPGRATA